MGTARCVRVGVGEAETKVNNHNVIIDLREHDVVKVFKICLVKHLVI